MKILLFGFSVFLLNIPFGYWRANIKSKSLKWFATIHIPVLITIIIRFQSGIDFSLFSVLLNVFSFTSGQFLGIKLFALMRKTGINGTSCLIVDLKEYFLTEK